MTGYVSEAEIRKERVRQLMAHCETSIIDSIIIPFGLNHAMFQDKDGGSLPTLKNARNGTLPDEKYATNYAGYDPSNYDRDKLDDRAKRGSLHKSINQQIDAGETVEDSYSQNNLEKDKHIDHVVSLKEFAQDESAHLWHSERERKDIANSPENLAPTSASINTSKKDKSVEKYLSGDKIHPDVDPEMMRTKDKEARTHIRHEKTKKIALEASEIVAKQAAMLGLRQGIGIVLREMTSATFVEVKDVYANGWSESSDDLETLKIRSGRVLVATRRTLKKALRGAAQGAISGVISELMTWLINQAKTTAKNLVRIIREGILKLVEAIWLILKRPPEISLDDAIRAAVKIVAGVLGLSIGIAAEESLKALLMNLPFVNAFAAEIAAVVAAILSGLVMGITVYLIDMFFDKLSMPFNSQSLDMLAKSSDMQQQLCKDVTEISQTYTAIIERLDVVKNTYDQVLQSNIEVANNFGEILASQKPICIK